MDGSILKKAISVIKNQLETVREQEVEVIDLDATTNNFEDISSSPKLPSLQRAVDEAIAAPVARLTLASESPTPTGRTTEEEVAPSPVKLKLSNPALILLNTSAFQPSTILARGDSTAAAKKKAKQRALQPILEAILRPSLTREQQVLALRNPSTHPKLHLHFSSVGLQFPFQILSNAVFCFPCFQYCFYVHPTPYSWLLP